MDQPLCSKHNASYATLSNRLFEPISPKLDPLEDFTPYELLVLYQTVMSSNQTSLAYTIQQTVWTYLAQINLHILLYLCQVQEDLWNLLRLTTYLFFFVTDYHVLETNFTGTCNKNWYVIKCICVCPGICHTTDCLNLSRPNYLHILLCLCQCRRVFEQFYGLRATCFFVTDYHVLETNFTGTCNKIWCVIRCICVCVFLP